LIAPAKPPFPTPWNLPFQIAAGIQISIPMSESLLGVRLAATRQNAGMLGKIWPSGALYVPAGIDCATVMVVFGSLRLIRLSQVAATA